MSSFSKGPYQTELKPGSDVGYVLDVLGDAVACVDSTRTGNALANTHLLAASFDLLSSLQEILPLFESCIAQGNGELEGDREAIQCAKNAIAKARGTEVAS